MECLPDGVLAWHVAGGAQPFLRMHLACVRGARLRACLACDRAAQPLLKMHLACVRIVPLLWQPGLARGLAAKLAIESS